MIVDIADFANYRPAISYYSDSPASSPEAALIRLRHHFDGMDFLSLSLWGSPKTGKESLSRRQFERMGI
jgi:hypothetical protein